ncbi:hypothetical protein OW763_10810 [Clostridium aestuarii]|uniref:DUF4179 domain-containing protein n=1 Tax=Clostridium aestuarii TaxID=338193 RepID=A0ABT4D0R8_9CLOT|nr:hypothetical protein [Clostridium aestuarii]MCY6484831.1 hypothetical protein [Clostridium aestuarii]
MNEDRLNELLNNCDDDLIEKEIDKLLEGVEINMDSIKKKAYQKLNNSNKKVRRKKRLPYIAAAVCICSLSLTSAYAEDISQAIKSFMNKTPVYSTMVDGDAYCLNEKYELNKDITINSVMSSKGKLEMKLTTNLSKDELKDINIISKNNSDTVYSPGGYSEGENEYFFSFMNETKNNYDIKAFKDFKLVIAGKSYDVSLEKAKSLDLNKKIYTAEAKVNNIKGVNVGVTKTVDKNNNKFYLQLITSFEDKDLKLNTLGKPIARKVECMLENGKNGISSSSTSSKPEDIYVFDEMNNKYKLSIPENSKGRPVTTFETKAPKNKNLVVKLPALVACYEKTIDTFSLDIPSKGEKILNKKIDFNIQKAVLKKITRVSSTSAKVEFELNTDGDKNIDIRSFDFYSRDVKKINAEFNGDKAVINLEFDKNIDNANIEISYPEFTINGDWVINMK